MRLPINGSDVREAASRINGSVVHTPIVTSRLLNHWLGHNFFFKMESLQRVGAFKARGALNALSRAVEQGTKVSRVIANSSGNHAQAVAWAASSLGLKSTIYMPSNVSKIKAQATASYGAEVVFGDTREWVDLEVAHQAKEFGTLWVPPYNHRDVMAGQGTAVLEALTQVPDIDLIAAPCGGGGLLSGSLAIARDLAPNAEVIGAEPLEANDAARSLRATRICSLETPSSTLADGARTICVGDLTFPMLQQLDGFYEVSEGRIAYWYQWLNHLLKYQIEPTSAMSMDAVIQHLSCAINGNATQPRNILVVLSGGNVDTSMRQLLWSQDFLSETPSL